MAKLVSTTYAQALFEVAMELDSLDQIKDELGFINESFKTHPEFYEVFRTPKINKEERKDIITKVFDDKVSKEVMNFMKILIDKRRGTAISSIYNEYVDMLDDHKGVVKAVVESAVPLTDEEQKALTEKLAKVTGREVHLSSVVKPEVIGGIIVKIGDKVIDGSVRSRLDIMKDNLAQLIV
ncbi:F0F1 ATP synthase subunit delta [Fusibacter sp. JL216-2]|uniref:F0F1 ATP synthase subunit delta n=1 Tax=Fusibacter sp. JL216-2 TaxID=3071453 RepID=UPI003D348047